MTREQLDLIPDDLLLRRFGEGAAQLIQWLRVRGWQMTLLELETERRSRGIRSGQNGRR
jgi:hypothetical protein